MSESGRDDTQCDENTKDEVVDEAKAPVERSEDHVSPDEPAGGKGGESRLQKKGVEPAGSGLRGARARRSRLPLVGALVIILVAVIGGGLWLNGERTDAGARADAARAALADLAVVRKTAEDYTKKALTIDFNRAEDYVKALADGTTQTFGDTFAMNDKGAGPLIVELQQQLRMVASGDVVHSLYDGDLASPPSAGQPWDVIVIANQTSTTAQQPDKSTQVMVLKVVVVQLDGQWKIANFGPDPKSMGAATAIPGVK